MGGKNKLKEFLKSDIATRIIAFIIAIIVWIYVVILIDPAIDIVISDIPVLYTNTISLTNEGYVVTNEKSDTVTIKVRGSRAMLAKINKSDISAFIDLNGYNQTGTFSLPISIRLPLEELDVVEKKPYGINVTIDKIVTQSFPVTVEITGATQEGYDVYESMATPSFVELKGPSELVASIEKVVASVDVDGASNDIIVVRDLKFYNTNQDIVASKHLTSSPEKAEIRCEILKRKNVAVEAILKNAGSNHHASVISNSQITILGKPEVLKDISVVYT